MRVYRPLHIAPSRVTGCPVMRRTSMVLACLVTVCGTFLPVDLRAQPTPAGSWDEARVKRFLDSVEKAKAEQPQINRRQDAAMEALREQQRAINAERARKLEETQQAHGKMQALQSRNKAAAALQYAHWKSLSAQGSPSAVNAGKRAFIESLNGVEKMGAMIHGIEPVLGMSADPAPSSSWRNVPAVVGGPVAPVPGLQVPAQPTTERRITLGENRAFGQAVRINQALEGIDLSRIGEDLQPGQPLDTDTEKALALVSDAWQGGQPGGSGARIAEISRINQRIAILLARCAEHEAKRIEHNANPGRTQAAADAGTAEGIRLLAELEALVRELRDAQNR